MECIIHTSNNAQMEFVETQTEWNGKWNRKIMYYDVIGECRTMTRKQIRKALNYAMTTWDIEIPVTFEPIWNFRGKIKPRADITIDFKSSEQDDHFAKKPSVLAYAYFPAQGNVSGKVVFNDDYLWDYLGLGISGKKAIVKGWVEDASPTNKLRTYSIIAVLIHELGHSLGLRHDVSGNYDGKDSMDAIYSGKNRLELSERDIYRIVSKYGNRIYSRWSHYARLKKALRRGKLRLNILK